MTHDIPTMGFWSNNRLVALKSITDKGIPVSAAFFGKLELHENQIVFENKSLFH
jgi:hypothetical protein